MADFARWLDIGHPLIRILLIWLLAALSLRFLRRLLDGLRQQIAARVGQSHQARDFRRVDTLSSVFRHTVNVVIVGLALVLSLSEFGIAITPILATAGVAGIAIGFGAQSLVKDFFSGLFLLLENQVSEGDTIDAAGKSGYVERVTLRHVRIRDYDGSVHYIPNGMISLVTNRSRGFTYAVIELGFPRREDPQQVFTWLRAVTSAMRADPTFGALILDDIDIAGIEKLEEAAVTVRCRIKVMPSKHLQVRHEFLLRMKALMDASPESPQTAH